jgi:hypothetical protein
MKLVWRRLTAYLHLNAQEDAPSLGGEPDLARRAIALSEWPGGAAVPVCRRYDAPT